MGISAPLNLTKYRRTSIYCCAGTSASTSPPSGTRKRSSPATSESPSSPPATSSPVARTLLSARRAHLLLRLTLLVIPTREHSEQRRNLLYRRMRNPSRTFHPSPPLKFSPTTKEQRQTTSPLNKQPQRKPLPATDKLVPASSTSVPVPASPACPSGSGHPRPP